jgi:hypothetical protein
VVEGPGAGMIRQRVVVGRVFSGAFRAPFRPIADPLRIATRVKLDTVRTRAQQRRNAVR